MVPIGSFWRFAQRITEDTEQSAATYLTARTTAQRDWIREHEYSPSSLNIVRQYVYNYESDQGQDWHPNQCQQRKPKDTARCRSRSPQLHRKGHGDPRSPTQSPRRKTTATRVPSDPLSPTGVVAYSGCDRIVVGRFVMRRYLVVAHQTLASRELLEAMTRVRLGEDRR